jgi:hypothetical protein
MTSAGFYQVNGYWYYDYTSRFGDRFVPLAIVDGNLNVTYPPAVSGPFDLSTLRTCCS